MRILFAGGGSIGHIAPCIAVWKALRELQPDIEVHMICSERSEDAEFLTKEGMSFTQIPAWKLLRQSPLKTLAAFRAAKKVLTDFHPDVVFCKGGAVSVPVAWAAKRASIPIVLHESDSVSGRANRLISRWATSVCLGFPPTTLTTKTIVTGNPVRADIAKGSRVRGLALTGFSGTRPILLVLGGSQGATTLNEAVRSHLTELLTAVDIMHLTGAGKTGAGAQPGYYAMEFAHESLPDLYAIADLALSRAGAGSIAELAACGIPTILVPLPGLAQDHQTANARIAAEIGGAMLLPQKELEARMLSDILLLAQNAEGRKTMREKMHNLHRIDAASVIAGAVVRAAGEKERE